MDWEGGVTGGGVVVPEVVPDEAATGVPQPSQNRGLVASGRPQLEHLRSRECPHSLQKSASCAFSCPQPKHRMGTAALGVSGSECNNGS